MTTESVVVLAYNYMTKCDVYAKPWAYPSEEGDGIFVGTISFNPWEPGGTITWTLPTSATYFYGAVERYSDTPGLFHRLDGT
jgi:hypothetical protein